MIENHSLKTLNTFGLNVSAKYFAEINNLDAGKKVLMSDIAKNNKILILGGGSNVLLTQNIDGLVLLNKIEGIKTIAENENNITLKIGAGVNWNDLVNYCVSNNWGGIENLSLIPGCVGAAPMQNIGAYGSEIKDVLVNVYCINIVNGDEKVFAKKECELGYRNSIFKGKYKGKYFISHISICLNKNPAVNLTYGAIKEVLSGQGISNPSIADVSNAVVQIRKSKLPDPNELGNAGSFFKNPVISSTKFEHLEKEFEDLKFYKLDNGTVKIPAGWLIEKAGWKGKKVGETGNHNKQALVIVNYGKATGKEILKHAQNVQKNILDIFDIQLEMEVNVL